MDPNIQTPPSPPTIESTPPAVDSSSPSQHPLDTTSIVVILLLLFMYPIGLLVMIFGTRWQRWVKFVAALPFIFAVIFGIAGMYLFSSVLNESGSRTRTFISPTPYENKTPSTTTEPSSTSASSFNLDEYKKKAAPQTDLIQNALELYKSDTGSYPSTLTALAPKYLQSIPLNPHTNQPFEYQKVSATRYVISVEMGDGATYSVISPETEATPSN